MEVKWHSIASTSKETPEREASYSQTCSVYSSIYTCTYEHVSSLSASMSDFASEITSSRVSLRVQASARVCTSSSEFELLQQCSS